MAKRKISGIINATEHPMNLETPWSQKQTDGTYHAYAGDDVEAFLKKELSNRTPTEELVSGETKPPTSGTVFDAMVGTVTDVDVQDSEDGTQYVMTVKQKDNQGGESSKEVRFSKYTDDDKVVVNIDLTDSGGAGLPSQQYLALGSGFVVKYSVGVGTAGGGTVDGYSDLKARVIVKRGSTVISEFQDAEFVGVTAGQAYTFDASPYLTDATAYTVQVEAQAYLPGRHADEDGHGQGDHGGHGAGDDLLGGQRTGRRRVPERREHPLYSQGYERRKEHLLPCERRTGLYPRSFGRQRCAAEERDHPADPDAGRDERGGSLRTA